MDRNDHHRGLASLKPMTRNGICQKKMILCPTQINLSFWMKKIRNDSFLLYPDDFAKIPIYDVIRTIFRLHGLIPSLDSLVTGLEGVLVYGRVIVQFLL